GQDAAGAAVGCARRTREDRRGASRSAVGRSRGRSATVRVSGSERDPRRTEHHHYRGRAAAGLSCCWIATTAEGPALDRRRAGRRGGRRGRGRDIAVEDPPRNRPGRRTGNWAERLGSVEFGNRRGGAADPGTITEHVAVDPPPGRPCCYPNSRRHLDSAATTN